MGPDLRVLARPLGRGILGARRDIEFTAEPKLFRIGRDEPDLALVRVEIQHPIGRSDGPAAAADLIALAPGGCLAAVQVLTDPEARLGKAIDMAIDQHDAA